ncbi:SA1362 family protein [Amphibacillus cookii]|uniref:SA1362 family protein n=1 Tax=Amphibacillus cookii TaxID=767787 RepID=UPI00195BF915|nr:SA1362 family protein [Amphibacillus cookii]MBM7542423.1 putative ferric reductase [Amphibacillus cookii]
MKRNYRTPLMIYLLLCLAGLGLFNQLFFNSSSFLRNSMTIIGGVAIVYLLVYFFFLRKPTTNELKKYRQAVKQSKRRNKKSTITKAKHARPKSVSPISRKRSGNPPHLRVIDGKKSNRKGRASL